MMHRDLQMIHGDPQMFHRTCEYSTKAVKCHTEDALPHHCLTKRVKS